MSWFTAESLHKNEQMEGQQGFSCSEREETISHDLHIDEVEDNCELVVGLPDLAWLDFICCHAEFDVAFFNHCSF